MILIILDSKVSAALEWLWSVCKKWQHQANKPSHILINY